jgi:hypothetical protein
VARARSSLGSQCRHDNLVVPSSLTLKTRVSCWSKNKGARSHQLATTSRPVLFTPDGPCVFRNVHHRQNLRQINGRSRCRAALTGQHQRQRSAPTGCAGSGQSRRPASLPAAPAVPHGRGSAPHATPKSRHRRPDVERPGSPAPQKQSIQGWTPAPALNPILSLAVSSNPSHCVQPPNIYRLSRPMRRFSREDDIRQTRVRRSRAEASPTSMVRGHRKKRSAGR